MANQTQQKEDPDPLPLAAVVQVRRQHVDRVCANQEKIRSFFHVDLVPGSGVDGVLVRYRVVPVPKHPIGNDDEAAAPDSKVDMEGVTKRVQVSKRR